MVVCALVPFLGLSSALGPLQAIIGHDVGLSPQAMSLTNGMANAAYALGTVLSVQLAVHYPQRRLLVTYAGLFTIASALAATAITPGLFIAGHVLQGLLTSMMLIAAAPPLVLGFPLSRLPTTGVVMNMGIFGAVAGGPFFGGLQANADAWRPLLWIVCGIGGVAFVLSLLTFTDDPAQSPDAPRDWWAIVLAGLGCAAAFFGAAELQTHAFLSLIAFGPLLGGAVLLVTLVLYSVLARDPLMPMAQLLTTFCVALVGIAIAASASSIPIIVLVQTSLAGRYTPVHLGVLLLPFLGGAVFTALLFGLLIKTRFVPLLAWTGLLAIAGGATVLLGINGGSQAFVLVGSGLLGLGVGSSVGPALFALGFTLHAGQLPRVYAMLELLRGAAAFAAAPIIAHFAQTVGGSPSAGLRDGIWLCFAIAIAGALVAAYVFILGRGRLQVPDLANWEKTGAPAWVSPPLFAGIRHLAPATGGASHNENGNGNGHALLDPGSREAAEVEAYARAVRLARGADF
jgi:MFS family permease